MPSETSLRDQLRDLIVKQIGGFVTNHEDKFTRGIPDTSFVFDVTKCGVPHFFPRRYVSGWIELKHHHSWPKIWTTELKLGIRAEQRIWIRERWKHGRDVFVLVRIEDEIFMFEGSDVDTLFFPITRQQFQKLWIGKWQFKIDRREFVELVCASR